MSNMLKIERRLEELDILIEHERQKDEKEIEELKPLLEKIELLQLEYSSRENKLYRRYNDYRSERDLLKIEMHLTKKAN